MPFARNQCYSKTITLLPQRAITCSLSCRGIEEFLPQKGDLPDEDGKLFIG